MKKLFKQDRSRDIKTGSKTHNIRFETSGTSYSLYVDGEFRETFKMGSIISSIFGDLNDYAFDLDGSRVIVAMRFGRMRVAVNGKYTDNDEEFRPVQPLPMWATAFIIAIMLPPVFLNGSFFDYTIAACCVYMCTHYIIKNPDFKISMTKRILYSILVTLASWAFFGMFVYLEGGRGFF